MEGKGGLLSGENSLEEIEVCLPDHSLTPFIHSLNPRSPSTNSMQVVCWVPGRQRRMRYPRSFCLELEF